MSKLCNKILFVLVCIFFCACKSPLEKISSIPITDLYNEEITLSEISDHTATVITFLSPECPLSENYTKTLNDIQQEFKGKNIDFINIFPGTFYSAEEIHSFIKTYNLKQNNLPDKKLLLVKYLNASITPEVFVLNNKGSVVYSGAIDNWAIDLGEKRQVITEFYLKDALNAILQNKKITISKTKAVGCFIETD